MFDSRPFDPLKIDGAVACYTNDIIVGFDGLCEFPGICDFSSDLALLSQRHQVKDPGLSAAVRNGVKLHAYVEGPGGKTDKDWSKDEKARIVAAAATVGISIKDPAVASCEMNEWRRVGWRTYTYKQLTMLKRLGFETAEIDNLDQDARIGEGGNSTETIAFYREYSERRAVRTADGRPTLPRLVVKNLTKSQWVAVGEEIKTRCLTRELFADFAISEGHQENDLPALQQAADALGITIVLSRNTNDYHAWGPRRDGGVSTTTSCSGERQ